MGSPNENSYTQSFLDDYGCVNGLYTSARTTDNQIVATDSNFQAQIIEMRSQFHQSTMAVRVSNTCQKYGCPLYAGGWVNEHVICIGGGGGKSATGVPNRLLLATFEGGVLSDADFVGTVESDCPVAMAVHPDGTRAILALGSGGCAYFGIQPKDKKAVQIKEGIDNLSVEKVGCVQRLAFSADGSVLALGSNKGVVTVHEGSAPFKRKFEPKAHFTGEIKDIDVLSTAHGVYVCATDETGQCKVIDGRSGEVLQSLSTPKTLTSLGGTCTFTRARFAPGAQDALVTVVMHKGPKGRTSYLAYWSCMKSTATEPAHSSGGGAKPVEKSSDWTWAFRRSERAHMEPVTALAVSPCGKFIGTGTVEGSIAVFSMDKLSVVRRMKDAHMISVTGAWFARDSKALLSISADSSARCTPVEAAGGGSTLVTLLVMLILAALALAVAVQMGYVEQQEVMDAVNQVVEQAKQLVSKAQ